ncbi:zwei Ig domain protein zig-8-like [Ctenocephalides felis]|uniref:zwei Ig domain protein zig-8-like n=1 Tax=Ctenocephalides felis TaxID=7515 RepID=UPI000E6E1BFF|nr:zwei Ig domain protein zig-8-like [Ctenocephalides felis]
MDKHEGLHKFYLKFLVQAIASSNKTESGQLFVDNTQMLNDAPANYNFFYQNPTNFGKVQDFGSSISGTPDNTVIVGHKMEKTPSPTSTTIGPFPEFGPAPRNVESSPGQTALLHCNVRNLGDRTVSWIRGRDLHILTSGRLTFTADPRFSVSHTPGDLSWGLVVKKAKLEDSGRYECQVNTDPKINYNVTLVVKEPQMQDSPYISSTGAAISGPRLQTVKIGSTLTLTCSAPLYRLQKSSTGQTERQVTWTKDGQPVSFQAERGGISVDTVWSQDLVRSSLTVALVGLEDAGSYACAPPGGPPDKVELIVVKGEHTEAMKGSSSADSYLTVIEF